MMATSDYIKVKKNDGTDRQTNRQTDRQTDRQTNNRLVLYAFCYGCCQQNQPELGKNFAPTNTTQFYKTLKIVFI